jgi:hypothetical protein
MCRVRHNNRCREERETPTGVEWGKTTGVERGTTTGVERRGRQQQV